MVIPTLRGAKVGVIGHPIGQSKSPLIHNDWLGRAGLPMSYHAIDGGDEAQFREIVEACRAAGWLGLNVTLPFKATALALADEASHSSKDIGAANLLLFKDDKIFADNTDREGFRRAALDLRPDWVGKTALVMGAGGATPAILWALQDLGVERVLLTNRTVERAMPLKDRFDTVTIIDWEEKHQALAEVDLLINATSLGMVGSPPLTIDLAALPARSAVLDIVTTPLETPLLAAARQKGHQVQNGIPMLVYQAVPSFEAWFGQTPDGQAAMIQQLQVGETAS